MEGTQENEERWKRMTSLTSGSLDQLVGQMYVEKYFPPACKQRMDELAANIKKAFESRLRQLPWMSEATRQQALEKLLAMRIEVGYPSKWEDYGKLEVGRDSLVDNLRRAGRFAFQKNLDQLGKPVDTTKWDMPPQIVNAGYNPVYNKMIFPAGILQPPFFFADADDAVNYGAIGMAIGHEMSHGFDDQGRWFDKDGNMRDWWTPEDAEKFKQQTKLLVEQYGAFASEDGVHVNGELSLGENIADYAGLTMSLAGYHLSLQGKTRPGGHRRLQRRPALLPLLRPGVARQDPPRGPEEEDPGGRPPLGRVPRQRRPVQRRRILQDVRHQARRQALPRPGAAPEHLVKRPSCRLPGPCAHCPAAFFPRKL